jgi:hypothetical protein
LPPSLRPQIKFGNLKKADAQGYDPVFSMSIVANGGNEPFPTKTTGGIICSWSVAELNYAIKSCEV